MKVILIGRSGFRLLETLLQEYICTQVIQNINNI